jgi:hypothetical protein
MASFFLFVFVDIKVRGCGPSREVAVALSCCSLSNQLEGCETDGSLDLGHGGILNTLLTWVNVDLGAGGTFNAPFHRFR